MYPVRMPTGEHRALQKQQTRENRFNNITTSAEFNRMLFYRRAQQILIRHDTINIVQTLIFATEIHGRIPSITIIIFTYSSLLCACRFAANPRPFAAHTEAVSLAMPQFAHHQQYIYRQR